MDVLKNKYMAKRQNRFKNYKSFIVHGSVVDIMAIQLHFRYISMIIQFSHSEHFKVICLVICHITNLILECTVYEVTANIKMT